MQLNKMNRKSKQLIWTPVMQFHRMIRKMIQPIYIVFRRWDVQVVIVWFTNHNSITTNWSAYLASTFLLMHFHAIQNLLNVVVYKCWEDAYPVLAEDIVCKSCVLIHVRLSMLHICLGCFKRSLGFCSFNTKLRLDKWAYLHTPNCDVTSWF